MLVQVAWLWLLYPEVRFCQSLPEVPQVRYRLFKPLLTKTLLVTAGLLLAFLVGAPLAESVWIAASILLITRRVKSDRILPGVDWNVLVMFAGLFVVTEATQQLGLLDCLTNLTSTPLGLLRVTLIMSNLISNVPAVLILQSQIFKTDTSARLMLAAGSTLAGNREHLSFAIIVRALHLKSGTIEIIHLSLLSLRQERSRKVKSPDDTIGNDIKSSRAVQ
ncbi:SLC13 family permease [Microcoleus sp. herbarium12]